jgi:hypothetical protein
MMPNQYGVAPPPANVQQLPPQYGQPLPPQYVQQLPPSNVQQLPLPNGAYPPPAEYLPGNSLAHPNAQVMPYGAQQFAQAPPPGAVAAAAPCPPPAEKKPWWKWGSSSAREQENIARTRAQHASRPEEPLYSVMSD